MNGVQYLQTIGEDGLPYLSAVDNRQFYYQPEPVMMSEPESMSAPVQVASTVYNPNKAIAPIAYREDPSTNGQLKVYSKNKAPAPVYYQEQPSSPHFKKRVSGDAVAPNIVVINESNDTSSSSSSEDEIPPTITTTTTTAAKRKRPTYNKPYVKSWYSGIPRLILIVSIC